MTGAPAAAAPSHGSPAKHIMRWAVVGLAAQGIFTLGWLLADRWQGPGYSPVRYTISDETALGAPHAWFLITAQLLAGAGTIGFALFGLRPALGPAGPAARYAPWLLATGALAYLVIWPRLPCRLADAGCSVHQHLASTGGLTDAIGSGLLIGVLVMTPFPLWRRLRELPEWQRARPVMIAARLLGPALLIAAAAQGPYAPGPQEGIFERALALLTAVWIGTLAVILITITTSAPGHQPARAGLFRLASPNDRRGAQNLPVNAQNLSMKPAAEMPCVFCEIIAGRAESSLAYEDEHVIAFMDVRPLTPGHLLVVPRSHADCLEALDEELGAQLFRAGHRLARALRRSGLPCDGVNLFLADGEAAFQEVFHVHLHVLPRTPGDGFRIKAAWRRPDRGQLDVAAGKVRQAMRTLPG